MIYCCRWVSFACLRFSRRDTENCCLQNYCAGAIPPVPNSEGISRHHRVWPTLNQDSVIAKHLLRNLSLVLVHITGFNCSSVPSSFTELIYQVNCLYALTYLLGMELFLCTSEPQLPYVVLQFRMERHVHYLSSAYYLMIKSN